MDKDVNNKDKNASQVDGRGIALWDKKKFNLVALSLVLSSCNVCHRPVFQKEGWLSQKGHELILVLCSLLLRRLQNQYIFLLT